MPLLSGALWVLCFPKTDWVGLSWFALAPLLWFLYGCKSPGRAAAWAFAAGFIFYAGLLAWIFATCRTAGVAWPIAVLATAGLALAMAPQWAIFAAGFALFERTFGFTPPLIAGAWWVATEWVWARWVTRFPWGLAGYTRWRSPWVLPAAAAMGVWGLSLLVVQVNAAWAALAAGKGRSFHVWGAAPLVLAGFFALSRGLSSRPVPAGDARISVLQGNVDQYKKWDAQFVEGILSDYAQLARKAGSPALVIWPESALPGWLEDAKLGAWLAGVVRRSGTFHLVGAVSRVDGEPRNSAVLLGPDSRQAGLYHKRQLVPFGERVPLQKLLGRWIPVLGELGGMTPGAAEQEPMTTFWGTLSPSICYEAVFPDLMRQTTLKGVRLLVNLTNDGWYLDTAGPYQHFAMSVVRAAENRAYLIRAANTGISALVDPYGRVQTRTQVGERTVMDASFSLDFARGAPSLYARMGDVLPALCLACCVLLLFLGALEKKA